MTSAENLEVSKKEIERAKSDLLRAREELASTIAQFDDDARKTEEISKDWLRSWSLSLGVANGGGCVALGSALLNAKMDIWLVALPAIWLFSIGLIFSGLLPFAFYRQNDCYYRSFSIMRDSAKQASKGSIDLNKHDENRKKLSKIAKGVPYWHKASIIFGTVASVFFFFGVFWPILALTFKIKF
jgi:hypothetical protein